MTHDLRIEQLQFNPPARSAGIQDDDIPHAETVLNQIASRTDADVLIALPFDRDRVAIIRSRPHKAMSFHLWAASTYARLGNPFQLAEMFPPTPSDRGELPTLHYPPALLPRPTVTELYDRLSRDEMPLILGATQALVDGLRIHFGPGDATESTLRLIWDLLPDSTRTQIWLHTGTTPGTAFPFDVMLSQETPTAAPGVLTAEQCRDYPEGRYELALQIAIESLDQKALNQLFARRSSAETLRFAALLLVMALGAAAVARVVI